MSASASEVPFVSLDALSEALVVALSALRSAYDELVQVAETPVPLPEDVEKKLLEHEALVDALNRAPEEWKPWLRELFTEEMFTEGKGLTSGEDAECPTLLPGVLEGLESAWEALRRPGLVDPGVDAALREADVQ